MDDSLCVQASFDDYIIRRDAIDCLENQDPVGAMLYLPAADVKPVVHGEWNKKMVAKKTPKYDAYTPIWCCSCCGTGYDPATCRAINFCPNCGADMRT